MKEKKAEAPLKEEERKEDEVVTKGFGYVPQGFVMRCREEEMRFRMLKASIIAGHDYMEQCKEAGKIYFYSDLRKVTTEASTKAQREYSVEMYKPIDTYYNGQNISKKGGTTTSSKGNQQGKGGTGGKYTKGC